MENDKTVEMMVSDMAAVQSIGGDVVVADGYGYAPWIEHADTMGPDLTPCDWTDMLSDGQTGVAVSCRRVSDHDGVVDGIAVDITGYDGRE